VSGELVSDNVMFPGLLTVVLAKFNVLDVITTALTITVAKHSTPNIVSRLVPDNAFPRNFIYSPMNGKAS
jgi:hypothetical protein